MSYRKLSDASLKSSLQKVLGTGWSRHPLGRAAAVGVGALTPLIALANPTGGQVAAGSAAISSSNANHMVIDQSSQQAIINWQQFSVGLKQYVQFVQPDSSAVVLNRVISSAPSRIFGDITANGQVFLVNPNGIYFAPGSSLDVQGLVASTLDISDQNFMQGHYTFSKASGSPDAMILAQGNITTARGGYVVLSGDYVENDGRIQAESGRVYLAAGNGATLTLDNNQLISYTVDSATLAKLAGVVNAGDIVATGGGVYMTGDVANALTATAVNNQGFISAKSIKNQSGTIVLAAEGGELVNSGTLDANAASHGTNLPGGTILLRGNQKTELTRTSVIDAAGNGNGGFIELSGHTLGVRGIAIAGKGGKLLLDPYTINIVAGSNTSVGYGSQGTTVGVGVKFIANKLIAGSNVVLVASHSIANLSHAARTLTANTNLAANAKLTVETGYVTSFCGNICAGVGINPTIVPEAGTINLTGLTINIAGDFVAHAGNSSGRGGDVTLGNVTAANINITGSVINVGALTGTGSVTITAEGSEDSSSVHAGSITAGGAVTITQEQGNGGITTGKINAGANVTLFASNEDQGDVMQVGNVTAAGDVHMTDKGYGTVGLTTGNIKANGAVNITASDSSTNTELTVQTGTIAAASPNRGYENVSDGILVNLNAAHAKFQTAGMLDQGLAGSDCECGIGNISVRVNGGTGGSINVTAGGTVKSSHGDVTFDASGGQVLAPNTTATLSAPQGEVSITGREVYLGNVTASRLSVDARVYAHSSAFITQTAGTTLNAHDMTLYLDTSYGGDITLANLTASSAARPTTIYIYDDANAGNAHITVNGNITMSGKPVATGSSGYGHGGAMPDATQLTLGASGNGPYVHSVKVNGNINVTVHPGPFSIEHSSYCDCASGSPYTKVQGTGGVADVLIEARGSLGSAVITGVMNVKAPDAYVEVSAPVIQTGAINVTGSGHSVTRTIGQGTKVFGSSHNSAGAAILRLGDVSTGYGNYTATATIKAGNITVSGKGLAQAGLFASNISAGNIAVTAAAVDGKITLKSGTSVPCSLSCGSIDFYRGTGRAPLDSGSIHAGIADIIISGGKPGSNEVIGGSSTGTPATSIKTGSLSVTGVGQAYISLSGKTIQTQGLTAVATKGTLKGTGSSVSGANDSNHYAHTFDIDGGAADINLRSGTGGNGGLPTQNGGTVTITGNVSATGPAAEVDFEGKTIKVSGTVSITGSGGSVTSDTVFTPGIGAGYHTHFVGADPTSLNIEGGSGGSVSVAGKTTIKAPGLVGVIVIGNNVKLHGFSGSASAVKSYSVLNTRVSPTTQNLTLGSIGLIVADVKVVGGKAAFTSASDVGDITIKSKGDVALPTQIKISGDLNVQAIGSIFGTSDDVVGHFNAIQNDRPHAGSNSSGGPSAGALAHLAVAATAVSMVAGANINLSGTQLTIGNGTISSVHGDSTLILALTEVGLAPTSSNPNGSFIAGGSVSLGGLKMTGTYLLLQGTSVSVLGPVSVPAGALIQVAPFNPTSPMDIENTPVSSAAVALVETNVSTPTTFNLSNQTFLSLFPGTTIAVGDEDESGNATIGANGVIDIGSTNLIIDTSGTITGLSTVTSTGLVSSLLSILGPSVAPPTAGEIDPSTGNTAPPDNYKKNGEGADDTGDGGGGGTITQDTDTASVCH